MFGLLGLFGKSKALTALDAELREAGLHPHLLHDSVKLTLLRLVPEVPGTGHQDRLREPARLLAYCILGPEDFREATSPDLAQAVEERLEAVLDTSDSRDAEIVLLALTTGNADPAIAARFDVET